MTANRCATRAWRCPVSSSSVCSLCLSRRRPEASRFLNDLRPRTDKENAAMPVSPPDWLTKRGGDMWVNADASNWVVFLNSEPQYMLTPCPAAGKFMCQVKQTNNG